MKSAGGTKQGGKHRGRKTEAGLEEWGKILEENRASEEVAVGKEMQQSHSNLLQSLGHQFFLLCVLLKLIWGLVMF